MREEKLVTVVMATKKLYKPEIWTFLCPTRLAKHTQAVAYVGHPWEGLPLQSLPLFLRVASPNAWEAHPLLCHKGTLCW